MSEECGTWLYSSVWSLLGLVALILIYLHGRLLLWQHRRITALESDMERLAPTAPDVEAVQAREDGS